MSLVSLKGKIVLVTAGPTREYIDPVRYLSNPSTGQMGYALAEAAQQAGAKVILISGPTSLLTPARVKRINVVSAAEMNKETQHLFSSSDITLMVAAVADYSPNRFLKKKLKKQHRSSLSITLKPTKDILKSLGKKKKSHQFLVGFAAETDALVKAAQKKLIDKNLDMIVANHVTQGNAFGSKKNSVTILTRDGEQYDLPSLDKKRLAKKLIGIIAKLRES